MVIRNGLPRPETQIPVFADDGLPIAYLDMGWPEWMVGAEYDGEQHFTNPDDYSNDIVRLEFLASKGWTIVRVSATQLRHQRAEVLQRVRLALRQSGFPD